MSALEVGIALLAIPSKVVRGDAVSKPVLCEWAEADGGAAEVGLDDAARAELRGRIVFVAAVDDVASFAVVDVPGSPLYVLDLIFLGVDDSAEETEAADIGLVVGLGDGGIAGFVEGGCGWLRGRFRCGCCGGMGNRNGHGHRDWDRDHNGSDGGLRLGLFQAIRELPEILWGEILEDLSFLGREMTVPEDLEVFGVFIAWVVTVGEDGLWESCGVWGSRQRDGSAGEALSGLSCCENGAGTCQESEEKKGSEFAHRANCQCRFGLVSQPLKRYDGIPGEKRRGGKRRGKRFLCWGA
ncbi:hypothetical protein V8F33_014122 [Rhypophila sp. PSN 637]